MGHSELPSLGYCGWWWAKQNHKQAEELVMGLRQ